MCKWCEAKRKIREVMKELGLKSRELDSELTYWECEDPEEDSDEEVDRDEEVDETNTKKEEQK
jgi:hypothetical protein